MSNNKENPSSITEPFLIKSVCVCGGGGVVCLLTYTTKSKTGVRGFIIYENTGPGIEKQLALEFTVAPLI